MSIDYSSDNFNFINSDGTISQTKTKLIRAIDSAFNQLKHAWAGADAGDFRESLLKLDNELTEDDLSDYSAEIRDYLDPDNDYYIMVSVHLDSDGDISVSIEADDDLRADVAKDRADYRISELETAWYSDFLDYIFHNCNLETHKRAEDLLEDIRDFIIEAELKNIALESGIEGDGNYWSSIRNHPDATQTPKADAASV